MKNIMPQKSNLATPRENRPTVYPFFLQITKPLFIKMIKIFTGISGTPTLNFILDSVTKVKAAPFLLLDCCILNKNIIKIIIKGIFLID